MNTGIKVTWNGTIKVTMTSQKHSFAPRNGMRASAYAHIESNRTHKVVVTPAKTTELRNIRANGRSFHTDW